jgi:hypothetical protein
VISPTGIWDFTSTDSRLLLAAMNYEAKSLEPLIRDSQSPRLRATNVSGVLLGQANFHR